MKRTSTQPKRRYMRYSLASLLFIVLCVTGYFIGYRSGFDTSRADRRLAAISTRSYNVSKLVNPLPGSGVTKPDYDTLINLITTSVFPAEWADQPSQIHPFPDADAILITQKGVVHDSVQELIAQLLKLRADFDRRVLAGQCGQCGGHTNSDTPPICKTCGFTSPTDVN